MKYTSYIVNAPARPEAFGVLAIPAAMVGLVIYGGLYPGAVLMDGGRIMKLKYLLRQRELRKLRYIRCVLRSLDRTESRELIELLRAA